MDNVALRNYLKRVDRRNDPKWLSGLENRKQEESSFHDRSHDKSKREGLDRETFKKFYGNRKYYGTTALSDRYVDEWVRAYASGRVFLDYACGSGKNAIKAAKEGASLAIGIDISPISIEIAEERAREMGVADRTCFIVADAEDTRFPSDSVDFVICSGMLHHVDLSYAFPELRRVLRPGGRILAKEALNYNPLIKVYRMMTPEMRTDWEKSHILSLRDVRFASRFFEIGEVKFWHVTSIMGAHMPFMLPILDRVDLILTQLPLFRLLGWMFTFELISSKGR